MTLSLSGLQFNTELWLHRTVIPPTLLKAEERQDAGLILNFFSLEPQIQLKKSTQNTQEFKYQRLLDFKSSFDSFS